MEAFVVCVLVLLALVNLVLAVGMTMVLTKVFEIVKAQEERHQYEEEIKRQARSLIDIETPQVPYSLRR